VLGPSEHRSLSGIPMIHLTHGIKLIVFIYFILGLFSDAVGISGDAASNDGIITE
jgi:hypothetical protein